MARQTINVALVSNLETVVMQSAVIAYRIVSAIDSKDKLSDSKEKFVYVRAVRVLHNACEFLDRTSYRDLEEIEDKASDKATITAVKREAAKAVTATK